MKDATLETNVILVGNGFDLNYVLPTSYSNFLNVASYLSNEIRKGVFIVSVAQVFNSKELQDKDDSIKELMSIYKDKYDDELDCDDVEMTFRDVEKNEWFRYLNDTLLMHKSFQGTNWVDFEHEIKMVTEHFSEVFEHMIEENSEGVYLCLRNCEEESITKHICMSFPFFFLETDLEPSDECSRYAVISRYIEKPFASSPWRLKKTAIVEYLFDRLRELADMLHDYLRWFVDNPVKNLKKTEEINDELFQTWPWDETHVISFNYTHTLNESYGKGGFPTVHYVHGEIGDYGEIVLGVDSDVNDELESIDTTFVCFKKYFQRAYYETDLSYLKYMNDRARSESYNLIVIGHSLDVTDCDMIKETFEHARRIIIFYHNLEAKVVYTRNLIKILGKEKFEEYRKRKGLCFAHQYFLGRPWDSFRMVFFES